MLLREKGKIKKGIDSGQPPLLMLKYIHHLKSPFNYHILPLLYRL